ncbi:MAG TPA: hypothetical protein VHM02_05335, partial [Thermoanaerobaculia bacterium]|nr:hypothetical protein [Thermoanaerobaculia bacterium]
MSPVSLRLRSPHRVAALLRLCLLAVLAVPAAAQPLPVGEQILVAEPAQLPAVAVAPDGGFAVVWLAPDGEGSDAVWAQRFAADDSPLGPPRRVGTSGGGLPALGLGGGPVVGFAG